MNVTRTLEALGHGATLLRSGAQHVRNAEEAAFKAAGAALSGKGSIAALHRANAERALNAGARDASEGVRLVTSASSWIKNTEPLDLATADATARIDEALEQVRRGGPNDLIAWGGGSDGPEWFASWTGAPRSLDLAAGIADAYRALA